MQILACTNDYLILTNYYLRPTMADFPNAKPTVVEFDDDDKE